MSYLAAYACANASLYPYTEVSHTTGVGPTHNVVYLSDSDDKDDKEELIRKVPKVEYVTENE